MGYVSELLNKVSFEVNQSSINEVNNAIQTIKSTATSILGAIGIGISLSALNSVAEEFEEINNKIKYAVDSSEDLDEVQEQILEAANNSRVAYSTMADAVVDLKQSNSDVFPMDDAITFVEYVNKLGQAAGYSDSEIASMTTTIKQIAANGEASTSNITTMLQQTPALAAQIASALGVATDELSDMASEGELTIETIKEAILDSTDEIDAAMDDLNYTISDALLNIRNQWGFWVEDINDTFKITDTIAKALVSAFDKFMSVLEKVQTHMEWFIETIGGTENALKLVIAVAAGLFVAFNFQKIVSGISTVLKAIWSLISPLGVLLIAALAIFLVVEDFIGFMNGKDSVIEDILTDAGIDVDEFRENVETAWEKIQEITDAVWEGIKNVILPIIEGFITGIGEFLETYAPQLAQMLDDFANGEIDRDQWVQLGEDIANAAIKILEFIVAVKAISGVASIITKVAGFFGGIATTVGNVIKILGGGSSAAGAAAGAASGGGLLATLSSILEVVVAVAGAFAMLAGIAAVAVAAISLFDPTGFENIQQAIESIFDGTTFEEAEQQAIDAGEDYVAGVAEGMQANSALVDYATEQIEEEMSQALLDAYADLELPELSTEGFTLFSADNIDTSGLDSLLGEASSWGLDITSELASGIDSGSADVTGALTDLGTKMKALIGFSVPEEGPLSDFDTYMPDMMQLMASGIEENTELVTGALESMAEEVVAIMENMSSSVASVFDKMKSSISSKMSEIQDVIKSGFQNAADYIKSIASDAYTWGVDIIDNLISGIQSKTSELESTISDVASTVSAYIGFSEPEKGPLSDFHTYMPDMMELMATGIEESKDKVLGALEGLTGDMSVMAKANVVMDTTAAAAAGGMSAGNTITQNITISNKFEGDKAGQQKSAQAMDKATSDATSELARALAYTR